MTDITIDLYDDLDVIPNKFEQEKSELLQKYEQLKIEYDKIRQELDEVRLKDKNATENESKLKTMKANFDSVMLTAQKEIDRLKRQNEMLRKEKDDIVFRRAKPKYFQESRRDCWTQTEAVKEVTSVAKTDDNDRRRKRETDEKERNRSKRGRSRSRDKSENERKRGRYDLNDNRKEVSRRDRRRSSDSREKVTNSRTIVTRKLTRLSEEKRESDKPEKTRRTSERKKSQEKTVLEDDKKAQRKPRTPKKVKKQDSVERELENLLSGTSKSETIVTTNNEEREQKKDLIKDKKEKETKQKKQSKSNDAKKEKEVPLKPLELLWKERQVEATPDNSQNTSDIFCNAFEDERLKKPFEERKQRQLLSDLFSDSEEVDCKEKSKDTNNKKKEDLEDGEIVEESTEDPDLHSKEECSIKDSDKEKHKNTKIEEKVVPIPLNIKTMVDKKTVSKIVPGTIDDSACDLGEIMQKQSSVVQNDEKSSLDEKGLTDVLVQKEEVKQLPEKDLSVLPERLIEVSDLVLPEETVSQSNINNTKTLEAFISSVNPELLVEQSSISLLIAADVFLQNENTVKCSEEKKLEDVAKETVKDNREESPFTGFTSQEIQKSPRNTSNDSLKENICTPVTNHSQNLSHGSTPKTTTKSEPKQLLAQLNNCPDSSIPTPDTSKEEQLVVNTTEDNESLNSSASRKVIETKSTQYVVEETEDMIICTVNRRKKQKKEKKEKKRKHKHKDREKEGVNE